MNSNVLREIADVLENEDERVTLMLLENLNPSTLAIMAAELTGYSYTSAWFYKIMAAGRIAAGEDFANEVKAEIDKIIEAQSA